MDRVVILLQFSLSNSNWECVFALTEYCGSPRLGSQYMEIHL